MLVEGDPVAVRREVLPGHGSVVPRGIDMCGLSGPGHGNMGQFASAAVGEHTPGAERRALRP
jgi:hypothetical protein